VRRRRPSSSRRVEVAAESGRAGVAERVEEVVADDVVRQPADAEVEHERAPDGRRLLEQPADGVVRALELGLDLRASFAGTA
jgi:hypothetical protein